jgi:hypothetical protein
MEMTILKIYQESTILSKTTMSHMNNLVIKKMCVKTQHGHLP